MIAHKIKNISFVLLFSSVLFACVDAEHPEYYTIKNFEYEDFQEVELLKGKKLNIKELIAPSNILNLKNHLVVSDNKAENLLFVIDKKSNKVINKLGVFGRGPGEINHAWSLSSTNTDSTFWVYQLSRQLISKFSVYQNRPFSQGEIDIIKMSKSTAGALFTNVTFSSDTSFIGYMIDGKDKYVEFDLNMNKIASYDNWNHMLKRELPTPVLSGLYQGWLGYKNNKFVMAALNLDEIEITNKKTGDIISVRGPVHYEPKFTTGNLNGAPVLALSNESRGKYMYLEVTCSKNQFFALFSKDSKFGSYDIFAFDYEGNPIKHYQLDKKVKSLTVDEKAQTFYGLTVGDPEPNVLVFKY